MNCVRVALLAGIAVLGLSRAALADDQPFITLYSTDIDTAHEKELEQQLYFDAQKPGQAYASILSRTEFEYGVTDDFQVSLYGNYGWERSHPHDPLGPADTTRQFFVSSEMIYRFLNVYFDPIGLAVYFEPSYGDKNRELEARILLQKNFFNDNLRLAANFNFEDKWNREDGMWTKESAIEFFAGAAYNITPDFSIGTEFNDENDFEGLIGAGHNPSHNYYFGPTVQYVGLPFTVTLGVETQLPWAGNTVTRNGYAVDDERWRVGFRVNKDL